MSEDCRIDVWLWRARFFKTRSMAGRFVEEGRVRRTREGETQRLDKASRKARVGDELVFMLNHRLVAVQVQALGERRGPASEARGLYSSSLPSWGGTGGEAARVGDSHEPLEAAWPEGSEARGHSPPGPSGHPPQEGRE